MAKGKVESVPMAYINVQVPKELKKQLELYCVHHEKSIKEVVTEAIGNFLETDKN